MDIHTDKGQRAHRAAQYMAETLGDRWRWRWFPTPSAQGREVARVDGIYTSYHPERTIAAVAECKARTQSRAFFRTAPEFPNHYLITSSKIDHGVAASRILGVPFLLMVYLVPEMAAYVFPITNHRGEPLINFPVARSVTQATVNGGTASRENAFIPFDYARVYGLESVTAAEIMAQHAA